MERVNVNQQHKDNMSSQERIGYAITLRVGTMAFFYLLVLWQIGWMIWQSGLGKHAFDPYPYPFLLFCSNIIQLIFLPILAVGNNVLSKHSELRAENDLQTDIRNGEMLKSMSAKLDTLLEKNNARPN